MHGTLINYLFRCSPYYQHIRSKMDERRVFRNDLVYSCGKLRDRNLCLVVTNEDRDLRFSKLSAIVRCIFMDQGISTAAASKPQ